MNQMKSFKSRSSALVVCFLLAACGGGDGDGDGADSNVTAPTSPTSPTPPTNSGTTALACLSSAQFAVGYRETLELQVTQTVPGQPASSGTRRIDNLVTGTEVINGLTTTRTLGTETDTLNGTNLRTASYDALDGTRVLNLRLENLNGSTVTSIANYEPPPYIDFGLSAGQSNRLSYVTRNTTMPAGTTTTETETETLTFVGREDVTVPLGTFVGACRFKYAVISGAENAELEIWVAAGSGVPVKLTTRVPFPGGDAVLTEVLTAATVNGTALRP